MIAPKTTLNNLVFNYQVSCAAMAPKALNLSRLPQESSTLRWCSFKFSATFVKEPIWYSWSPQLIKNELKNGLNNLCLFSFIIMQQGEVLTRPLYYCILYLFGVFIACLAWPEDLNLLALAHFIHHHFKCMSAFLKNMVTIWCCWQHLVQLKKNSFTYLSYWGFVLLYVKHVFWLDNLQLKTVCSIQQELCRG